MPRPNIFDYATKELSQDAAIAWLLSWADPSFAEHDSELHGNALRLLAGFFRLHGREMPEIQTVEILTQSRNIDILCILNGDTPVIIEDKTGSSEHSGQLLKYVKDVTGRNFDPQRILPIYFKTHEQSTFAGVEKDGYKAFTRTALLEVLSECRSSNEILVDFRAKMQELDESFSSFRTLPLDQWHGQSWMGFYQELQRELGLTNECWKYVPNASGGFFGFHWGWGEDSEFGCGVYLQLEQDKFCFKVGDVDVDRRRVREKWYHLFRKNSEKYGFTILKPGRFGNGTYMTFALLQGDYRCTQSNGCIDLPATFERIRIIEAGFRQLLADAQREYLAAPERQREREDWAKVQAVADLLAGRGIPPGVDQWFADQQLVHDFSRDGLYYGTHTKFAPDGWTAELFRRAAPRSDILPAEESVISQFEGLSTFFGPSQRSDRGYVWRVAPAEHPVESVAERVDMFIRECASGAPLTPTGP